MSKNSNKKLKWVIPFAVLSLTCASVGIMAGCNKDGDGEHTHAYEWKYNDTEHWKECPEDGEEEDGSRGNHLFVAGECECGATETVAEKKYGSVTGTIKLHKTGGYVTDFTGVSVDMGDDLEPELNKETGVFTVGNVEVGKSYSLKVTKSGYKPYAVTVKVEKENDTVTIGGQRGIVLEYEMFGTLMGWDDDLHDYSHVNDTPSYITFKQNTGGKSFNTVTKDSYGDVAVTYNVKEQNSGHDWRLQGIAFKFEDGKHLLVYYHAGNKGVMISGKLWNEEKLGFKLENSLFGSDAGLNEWGEKNIHAVTNAEKAAAQTEQGIELTAVLKDGKFYVLFDGLYCYSYQLPEGYAEKKAQVAFYAYNASSNAIFDYDISEQLPALETTLDIDVTNPEDGTVCTVTAAPQKDKYAYGEEVELTFTAPEGYKLETLTVNGVDKYNDVKEGKLTVLADRDTVDVNATFEKEQPIALNIPVKGKKLGATKVLAQDTKVTLSGIDTPFTVDANGKITGNVIKGRYTVSVEGYISKEVVIDNALTEIVLEYDLLECMTKSWGWGDETDLSKQNDGILIQKSGVTEWVSTKDSYDEVAVSVKLLSGGGRQGVFIRFKGEAYADDEYLMIQKENNDKISWNGEGNIWGNGSNIFHETWTNYISPLDLENEEYTVTLVRQAEKIYVFINNVYYDVKTIDEKYADMECYVGVYCTGIPAGFGEQHFNIEEDISAYFPEVTVNNGTEANAGGTISISPDKISVGDTVVITVTPDDTHVLKNLTVSGGVTAERQDDGTYTFVATLTEYTVTATFEEKPETEAEIAVSAIELGNVSKAFEDDTVVTFTPESGTAVTLTVKDGKVTGILLPGDYTVSVEGYYDQEATVGADGAFENATAGLKFEKIVFVYNIINENMANCSDFLGNVGDSKHVASTGKITATGNGSIYEWTADEYDDVAMTVTLKKSAGDQGLVLKFLDMNFDNRAQQDVRVRVQEYTVKETVDGEEKEVKYNKIQWHGGGWFWGTYSTVGAYDFMDNGGANYAVPLSDELLAKYTGEEGLKLTLVRKDGIAYALIDGEIYSAQVLDSRFAGKKVRMAYYAQSVADKYAVPVEITTDVDALLSGVTDAHNVMGVLGKWTVTENTLAVTGNGYAEFAPTAKGTRESLSITLTDKSSKAGKKAQGVAYRFADGNWIAARMETTTSETYIQYADDIVLPRSGGTLHGWEKVVDFDASKLSESGVVLTMIREGRYIYILLDGEVKNIYTLDAKYAAMEGVMATTIEQGTGTAFAYEYKSGDDVTLPARHVVTLNVKDGAYHGYDVNVDKNILNSGESVTLTIKTGSNWGAAWSYFPSSVKVNGVEKFVSTDMVSNGANHLTYTLTLDNVTENTVIDVEITMGETIPNGVVVIVKDNVGGTATSDSGENGYYWNDGCDIYMTPSEGYEIESITVDGEPVTSGWELKGDKYVYTLPNSITKPTTVVVAYKLAEGGQPDTGDEA